MGKTNLDSKFNENEPLNKKLKTIKLDDNVVLKEDKFKNKSTNQQNNKLINKKNKLNQSKNQDTKQQSKNQDTKQQSKNQNAKQQSKNQDAKQKKKEKIDKSDKLKSKDEPKNDDLKIQRQLRREKKKLLRLNKKKANKNQENSKKNQNLNLEDKLRTILKENENNKTIINHYKNLVIKVNNEQINGFIKQIKLNICDENLNNEIKNYLINDLNRFANILINQEQQNDILILILKFCALNSLFSTIEHDDIVKNMEEDTLNCFKNCFIKIINLIIKNLINKKKKTTDKTKLDILYQIMKFIYSNMTDNNQLKDDYNLIFKKISNIYKQIQLKDDDLKYQSILSAFFLFYTFLGLNLFDEHQNTIQLFDEINECFKRFSLNNDKKLSSKTNDLYWPDVLTDILLSLISQSNSLKRTVSDEVFNLISKEITKTGLEQLMTALISDNIEISDAEEEFDDDDENLEFMDAKEELSDKIEESEEEENDEESEEEENANDNEMEVENSDLDEENDLEVDENCLTDDLNKEEMNDKDQEESTDDNEETTDSESDTESIDDEFRLKIKNALGKAAIEDEDKSDDEIVYDDEEMLKFDEAISKVFKEKKKLKNKAQELIEFKSRCFDLVQILIKDANLDYLIEIAKTTLDVLDKNNNSKSYDLIFKASTTLKKYPLIEQSNKELINLNLIEFIEKCLNLIKRLPEKVRNNLNCFMIWLLDLNKSTNEIENLILNQFEKKLKKSSEVSLFIMLAERNKNLSKLIFKKLIQIELDANKLTNFEMYSYFKLLIATQTNYTNIDEETKSILIQIINKSLDVLFIKRNNKKAKFLIDELFRFLTITIKNNLDQVKKDTKLIERLTKLSYHTKKYKLNKKLRHKVNFTFKSIKNN